jgi:hypothetical protein
MAMAGCLALIQMRWREWLTFFVVASAIAVPQLLWSTMHSAVDAGSFFAWEFGWDHGDENPFWFWLKNTGLFIPLLLTAILMKGDGYLVPRRLLLFYLPFTLCFIVPNSDQDGAVDLGQYQGAVLLLAGFCSTRRLAFSATVAPGLAQKSCCRGAVCLCHTCWRTRRRGDSIAIHEVSGV